MYNTAISMVFHYPLNSASNAILSSYTRVLFVIFLLSLLTLLLFHSLSLSLSVYYSVFFFFVSFLAVYDFV